MTTQANEKVTHKKSGAKLKPATDADRERMRKAKAKQVRESKRLDAFAKDTLGTGKVESKVEELFAPKTEVA
jgi:adenine-specific DNA methylase